MSPIKSGLMIGLVGRSLFNYGGMTELGYNFVDAVLGINLMYRLCANNRATSHFRLFDTTIFALSSPQ